MGRPRKTLKDLPVDWEDIIVSDMSKGASLTEIKAKLGICGSRTYKKLLENCEEFSTTIKRGKELCEAWWLEKGRINLENNKFSATLWYMNMKNRFGWHDKPLVNVDNSNHKHFTVKITKDDSRIKERGNRIPVTPETT